jgi:hypothetical protein
MISTNPTKTACCANICKKSIREDIDHKASIGIKFMSRIHIMHPSNPRDEQRHYRHKASIGIRFMYRLHIMHPSNPRDEQRHYLIILHGLKHIGVMETPENIVDQVGGNEAWEHP